MNTYQIRFKENEHIIMAGADVMELDHEEGYLLFWNNKKNLLGEAELVSFYRLRDVVSAIKLHKPQIGISN